MPLTASVQPSASMNAGASQDGSQRGQLMFRRTSVACNLLTDKLRDVRINSEGSSSQLGPAVMSQDGGGLPPHPLLSLQHQLSQGLGRQPSQQLRCGLTIDTTRYPSQSDMAW